MNNTRNKGFWKEFGENALIGLSGILAMKFQWKFLIVAGIGLICMVLYYAVKIIIDVHFNKD